MIFFVIYSGLQGSEQKLDTIVEKFDQVELDLNATRSEVNTEKLTKKIKDKKDEIQDLDQVTMALKVEKNALESQRQIVSEITIKTSDMNEKQRKMDRSTSSKNSELTLIFGDHQIPKVDQMKDAFNEKRNELLKTKNELEMRGRRLNNEKGNKKENRKTLNNEIVAKEDRIKRFERSLQNSDLIEGSPKNYAKIVKPLPLK